MPIKENWNQIEEFPEYYVSDQGRIISSITDIIKTASINQQNIPNVAFSFDGKQHRRSVAVLVARAFLPAPPHPQFDTPINKDGNRSNNWADNLEWRPRWYAIKYHQQFNKGPQLPLDRKIIDINTEDVYPNAWTASLELGVIETDIFLSIVNKTYAFPLYHQFEYADAYDDDFTT